MALLLFSAQHGFGKSSARMGAHLVSPMLGTPRSQTTPLARRHLSKKQQAENLAPQYHGHTSKDNCSVDFFSLADGAPALGVSLGFAS